MIVAKQKATAGQQHVSASWWRTGQGQLSSALAESTCETQGYCALVRRGLTVTPLGESPTLPITMFLSVSITETSLESELVT